MAFIPVVLSLLFMLFAEQGTGKRVIELGSRLSPEGNQSSWASSSGHFAFGFYSQGDGFAVGIWLVNVSPAENTIVWTANRDSPPLSSNSTLQLTKTGLLFFQDGRQGQVLLSNFVDVTSSASMLDSGNFVLYDDTHNTVVWQSFEHPTDTILGGQNLSINAKLVSSVSNSSHSSGRFFLLMQGDGNLVAYPVNSPETGGDAYWASNTKGSTFQHLSLNVLGFLCLSGPGNLHCFFNHSISPGMKLQNKTSIYRSTVDVDGNLRLYEHQLEGNGSSHVQVLWSTPLKKCETKGFCGFNSYCSIVTGHAMCECFPGFVPSKSNGSVSLDCVLAHSKGSCKSSEDAMISYKITILETIADEGEREFRTEITAIARTHHKNLVKLIGFCINGARKLLVYEYVSNGSLASLLFNDEKHMSWRDRLKIALDVARGVLYLHEECEVRIIHCSINPRNILMDEYGLQRSLILDWQSY
ncbi:hypothetical protein GLYMA_13G166900v4 [Glycine max]|nr:hypothetical protein GLYMA_13G166900v4 [Glycine max]